MITTCNPKGCFSTNVFQSKDTFSHCFSLLSVNSSLAPDLVPLPSHGSCLLVSAEQQVQLQQLSKKATAKPFLLPQIPSLPTAQRKHPKHFALGFMAVLLFLNQGGKDLEVFINKGCMKTRLFIHSAAQSDNCPCFIQSHGDRGCMGTSLPAQGFCTAINQNKATQNDPEPSSC